MELHKNMALTLDRIIKEIKKIQYNARYNNKVERVFYPMIVLRTPKGWTGPKLVEGKKVEGTFRSHQVPIPLENDEELKQLEKWLKSYHPEELFDNNGHLLPYLKKLVPYNPMGANPNANGGLLLQELKVPSIDKYAVKFTHPGEIEKEDMRVLGEFIRDIIKENPNNFRVFV